MTAVLEEPAVAPAGTVHALMMVALDELMESPDNPRKHFEPKALEELADNIGKVGVLVPLLARPTHTKAKTGRYVIAAGHRRYRAAKLAGLTQVPVIVREMDDTTFLEVLTIDNLQRDDLHPLEEAAGFASLMRGAGYDVPKIAARVGRSVAYVYDRVKLLQLTPPAKELFLAGRMEAGHAIELARLMPTDQTRAIKDGLFVREIGIFETASEEKGKSPQKSVSVRELRGWIDQHVRFEEDEVDLPQLFPDTAAALTVAEEAEETVVHVTYNHQSQPDVRDEKEKTYHARSWKPADGKAHVDPADPWKAPKSKACDHSVLGVIVVGRDRGQSFRVCVDKQRCRAHWPAPKKSKAGSSASGKKPSRDDYWEKQRVRQAKEEEARKIGMGRWKRALPAILEAIATKTKSAPAGSRGALAELVLGKVLEAGKPPKRAAGVSRGTSAEDLVRYAAYCILIDEATGNDYWSYKNFPAIGKSVGIDVKKILDTEAPVERPAKVPVPKGTKVVAEFKGAKKKPTKAKATAKSGPAGPLEDLDDGWDDE